MEATLVFAFPVALAITGEGTYVVKAVDGGDRELAGLPSRVLVDCINSEVAEQVAKEITRMLRRFNPPVDPLEMIESCGAIAEFWSMKTMIPKNYFALP